MGEVLRIAQVLNRMDSGGIEMVLMNYYRHIARDKIQFDFYYADDSTFVQKEEMKRLGAGTYPIPAYSNPIEFHVALYQAFRKHKYRIVHVHLNTMSVFALFAAWRAGVPVRICHNHSTAHWSEGKVTLLKYMLRPLNKVFANRYYACGEWAGRWMYGKRNMESGKVTILPNAIDTKRFAYDPNARLLLRKELGIPGDAFVIGHVGRFKHQKNHRFLIALFKEVLHRKADAVLLLIGDGHKQEEIRMFVGEMQIADRVVFVNTRSDVNKLYSAMDVFCLPSYYEGMPLVAWEAQCNGLPCLLSDQVTEEAVLKKSTQRIPLNRIAAWMEAVLQAKRGHEAIVKPIDIDHYCRKLEQLYLGEAAMQDEK